MNNEIKVGCGLSWDKRLGPGQKILDGNWKASLGSLVQKELSLRRGLFHGQVWLASVIPALCQAEEGGCQVQQQSWGLFLLKGKRQGSGRRGSSQISKLIRSQGQLPAPQQLLVSLPAHS